MYTIARAFEISVEKLINANRHIPNPNLPICFPSMCFVPTVLLGSPDARGPSRLNVDES